MKTDTSKNGLETLVGTALTGAPCNTPTGGYLSGGEENVVVKAGSMEVDE